MAKKEEMTDAPSAGAPQAAHAARLHAAGIDVDRLRRLPVQEILAIIGAIAGLAGVGTDGTTAAS